MKLTGIVLSVFAAAASVEAFTMSAWSGTGYTGRAFSSSTSGTHNLGFTARSYKWSSSFADGCCAKTCNGNRETGSFCKGRSNSNVASGNRFNKVVLGCGSTVLNC